MQERLIQFKKYTDAQKMHLKGSVGDANDFFPDQDPTFQIG
jgi:hypothetical protein